MNWNEAHLIGDLEAQEARMTDDLVKRLREGDHFEKVMSAEQAADRIEALARNLANTQADFTEQLGRATAYELRMIDAETYVEELEAKLAKTAKAFDKISKVAELQDDRIEELEAKLAKTEARFMKAVDIAFEECPYSHGSNSYHDWWYNRRVAIEKLVEGTDDELG